MSGCGQCSRRLQASRPPYDLVLLGGSSVCPSELASSFPLGPRPILRGRPWQESHAGQTPDQTRREAHVRTWRRTVRRRLVGRHRDSQVVDPSGLSDRHRRGHHARSRWCWKRFNSAKFLAVNGANVNEDSKGKTALYHGVEKEFDPVLLKWLVKHGASPDIKDRDGVSPRLKASRKRDRRVLAAFA